MTAFTDTEENKYVLFGGNGKNISLHCVFTSGLVVISKLQRDKIGAERA